MVKLSFQLAENYSAANTAESAVSSVTPVQPAKREKPIKAISIEAFFISFPLLFVNYPET
jgi:hypothetical protein